MTLLKSMDNSVAHFDSLHLDISETISTMSPSGKTLIKSLEALFFALLLLTPLFHLNQVIEYFEFPKMFLVYFLGSLIIAVYLLGLTWKVFSFRGAPIFIYLFFATQIISTFFSKFPHTALWGYYPRLNGGLVSSLVYFGIFVVSYNTFDDKKIFKLIFYALVVSVVPISFLGIAQYFGLSGSPVARAYSTFGQPNWLALYLVWVILLVSHRFLKDPKDKLLFIWWSIFSISFLCLWFTYSLSGFLALLMGFSVLILLNKRVYYYKRIPFLLMIPVTIFLFFPGMFFMRVQDGLVDLIKLFSARFLVYAQNSYQVSDPGFIRLGLWEGALHISLASLSNFLVGTGPETFSYVFPLFRPLPLNFSSEWDFILNKPHNYYLELFSQTGIFSLVFYLWILLKAFARKHPWAVALFASFAVSNFFGWPSVVASLYFWVLLAGILQYEK
ncbi:O-antigen ligase family protein [Patescibacteria group bacterium]|nr:O-antigen ligase family protein [Patescibacteria group bacterium]